MSNERGIYYCFTLNNYTDDDLRRLAGLPDGGQVRYICWGRELAATGTPHLQGYLEMSRRYVANRVRGLLGGRAHIEIRRGTQDQAIAYCCKEATLEEHGDRSTSRQGRRTDLEPAIAAITDGLPLSDFALQFPEQYLRYRNGWRDLSEFARGRRKIVPVVIWLHGEPGTGKSKYAHGLHDDSWSYGGDGWFDGYTGQRVAIFDDFYDDSMVQQSKGISIGMFLKLTDRYPLQVPIKGGFSFWNPEVIIFTSNRPITELFFGRGDPAAIRRRFHLVHDIGSGQLEYDLAGLKGLGGGDV